MSPRRAPFGTWSSPITADVLVQSSISIVDVLLDLVTHKIYHVEGRPSEGGRAVIVDTIANKDIFGSEWNATTKVHEYGGGAAIVYDGTTYFSHSPDGRVYSLKDGSEPKAVTPACLAEVPFRYADFDLHPIHRHFLAAVLEDHTNDDPTTVVNTLVVINTNTQSLTTIASGADFYAAPRFSPDGARIAFQQWNHPTCRLPMTMREIAWGQREVSVGYPGWIDSDTLVFLTDESGFLNPWAYSVSSKSADPLLATPVSQDFAVPAFDLAGSPAIRAVDDKTLVFIARSTGTPSAIIKLTISVPSAPHPGVTYQTLKSSAESLPFPDSIISHPESLTLGTESEPVYATLYPPTNFAYNGGSDPTEKPPCIVNAHGGPTGMAAQGLDWTMQYFTSRGWAWVDVDYSGSGGYGRKYMAARTAIRGGLAGGFTTLAAVSQPATRHAFTVGTSFGISDLTRLAKAGTHKFELRYMDKLMGGTVEEIPDVYVGRSPVNNAQNVRSPLLERRNKVVPPEQADAIEKILQAQGRHVEKVLFDGHGFIKAESTIKVALETERGFYEKVFGIGS
ncbi:alpha/beta-hydrolase [Lactarius deliciosus]|nr:alpha/beta-hydrolase [Lactarius deliciosus]